jgi:hypothetical protein
MPLGPLFVSPERIFPVASDVLLLLTSDPEAARARFNLFSLFLCVRFHFSTATSFT